MSSTNHERNDYMHDLDLLTILHHSCVSYSARSGCREGAKL